MINTIKDIWYAITSPEKYRDFMNYNRKKLLLYVLVIVFVSDGITLGIPAARLMKSGGFRPMLEEGIPDFRASAEEGFWIEEPLIIDEYNFLIKADSSLVREDITDLDGQYGSYEYVIMVDQEQIYVKTPTTPEVSTRFDQMPGFSFTKADIMEYIPVLYIAALWIFLLTVLFDYGYYFLTAFVISWGAGVIASFMRVRLGNKRLFKMAVYAVTLSYLLSFIQVVIGKSIPNFTMFSLIISTGYMYFAIKDYKENGLEELPPEQFGGREDNL